MALPSKVPGSNNPDSPWTDESFSGTSPRTTTSPNFSKAMGLPQQAAVEIENAVNTSNDTNKVALSVVQGVKNNDKNVNV